MNKIAIFVVGLIALNAISGETNYIVQTNWVTAVPWYREVDGQLYNTKYSARFQPFSGEVEEVLGNAIVIQEVSQRPIYGAVESDSLSSGGNFLGSSGGGGVRPLMGYETVYGDKIFITNFPAALQPTTDAKETGRAMLKGTIQFNGEVLPLWDYGTPHIVRVVTTNEVIIKSP